MFASSYFNEELYCQLRNNVKDYNPEIGKKVVRAVHSTLVEALYAKNEEIFPDSMLVHDLDAEFIDGLDIAFRIERQMQIKFPIGNWPFSYSILYKNPGEIDEGKTPIEKSVLDLAQEVYNLKISERD